MNRYFAWFGLKGALVLTLLMSAYAAVLALAFPSGARLLCFAAMLMSSAGDIFLMHSPAIERRFPNCFSLGAACFMAAHLLYTACFAGKIRTLGSGYLNAGAIIALAAAGVSLVFFTRLCAEAGNFHQYPLALIYLIIITLNCTTVFSYAWSARGALPLIAAAGAASFFVSDMVIGLNVLGGISRYQHLVWWFYPIGQILLITGVGIS